MKKRVVKIVVCILVSSFVISFCGFSTLASSYSLEDLIGIAFENNFGILTERHSLEEADLLAGQAEAARDLRADVVLGTEYQRTTEAMESIYSMAGEEIGDSWASFSGTIIVSKVVLPSIENMAALMQAEKGQEDARENLRRKEGEVLIEVLEAAYNLFKARDGVSLAEEFLKRERRELERVQERLKQGEAVPRDVMEQEVEVASAEESVMTAKNLLSMAEKHLRMVVGDKTVNLQQLNSPEISVETLPHTPSPWPWDLARMVEIALERRPESVRGQIGMDIARIQLEEAKADAKPDISVEGSYSSAKHNITAGISLDSTYRLTGTLTRFDTNLPETGQIEISDDEWDEFMDWWEDLWDDDVPDWTPSKGAVEDVFSIDIEDEDEWSIGVQVKFNLFDSHLVESRIKEKEIAVSRMETTLDKVAEGLSLEVTSKYYDLEQAYTAVKTKKLAHDFSQRRASDMNAMYEAGLITISEKEMADMGVKHARNELDNALHEYEQAKARLGVALGLEIDWIISVLEV